MRILIVDDDNLTANALFTVLANQHYAMEIATDGQAALELIEAFNYDLILLDLMLPKIDGISLCKQVRSQGFKMPILLLTARDSSADKVAGLDAGADDYVVKPFDPQELGARVRALLRRESSTSQPILEWGNLQFDPSSCEVKYQNIPIRLTPKEYSLLELFLRNNRRVFSCEAILEHIWSYEDTPGEDAVRTQIKGLRQKLKSVGAGSDFVETVYGIGYRLKPLETKTLPKPYIEISEATKQKTLAELSGIWQRFKPKISAQLGIIEQAITALGKETLSQELQQQAIQQSHTLAGALGTFGLKEGSQLAKEIETLFENNYFERNQIINLEKLVQALRQEIEQEKSIIKPIIKEDKLPLLLVVDSDFELTQNLAKEADLQEISVKIAANLAVARNLIAQENPQIILLDIEISNSTEEGLSLLEEIRKKTPTLPVLIFTNKDSLEQRLAVAKLGVSAFLHKPIPSTQVLEIVREVVQKADNTKFKVLIVDDDPQILTTISILLKPLGMKVSTLADSREFWETLEDITPDILILDIEMPHFNGIELCQILRNDWRWSGLPIIFMIASTDVNIINEVFSIGADDFVTKPIVASELVTHIVNRLQHIKQVINMSEIDPLTKVSNRHKSTQDLNHFLDLASQNNQSLCLAIVDLDNFRLVNYHHGHEIGDMVLYHIAQLLQQSFIGENVVARWGGEEFIVGMYGLSKIEGANRLNNVLETMRQKKFTSADGIDFQVTFSAGVAEYPEDGKDLRSLYLSADTALEQGKKDGYNRISTC